jgi:hypothetical protein
MRFLKFIFVCSRCYFASKKSVANAAYFSVTSFGVPTLAVFIARDRDAWRVSDFAARYFNTYEGV